MSRMGMGVFLGDIIVFRGAIDLETGMSCMDIEEMRASSFKIQPFAAQILLKVLGNKASEGITSKVVKEVMWLHKCMGHPSRNVMAKNIANHSWIGISEDITASNIT